MPAYSVPAKEEMGSNADRKPLPGGEDYLLEIEKVESVRKPDFNGNEREFQKVTFKVLSFADGEPLEDVEGNPVEDRKAWRDIDLDHLGFAQNGNASLSRQFLIYANGLTDINERIPAGDTDDLVGRQVVGTMVVKRGKNGSYNNITAFKPLSRRRRGQAAPAAAPVKRGQPEEDSVSEEFTQAVARLVSGEDEPSDEDVAEVKSRLKA